MANPNAPRFPSNLPTDQDLLVAKSRALSKLAQNISNSATSFSVTDATKFNVPCLIQIDSEIIKVGMNSYNGNLLTNCTRGFAGTVATAHNINSDVKGYIFDWHHNQICAEIKAICAALGVSLGNVVRVVDIADGEITGTFFNLTLKPNGVVPGTYHAGPGKNLTLTVDASGRITVISDASAYPLFPVYYKAAIAQGNNAVLGFSFANTEAPNALVVSGAHQVYGVASFTPNRVQDYWVQDHFTLPDDFIGPLSLDIYWKSNDVFNGSTGSVVWGIQVASLGDGDAADVNWGTAATVIDPCGDSPNTINKATIASIPLSNIVAGEEFHFKFFRGSFSHQATGDDSNEDAHLLAIRFNVRRTFGFA